MKKKNYRLYAAAYTPETEKRMDSFRFCRYNCAGGFVLIYADKKPSGLVCTEIRDQEAGLLSAAERKWLFECNLEILAAETKNRSGEILRDLSLKVGKLEEALKAEWLRENQGTLRREEESDVGGENKT
jgi:hypothetical protein